MEQIGLLVLVGLFWLVQLIVRIVRNRRAAPPAPVPMPIPPPPRRREASVPDDEELVVRAPLPARSTVPPPAAPTGAPARVPGRRIRRQTPLGTRPELRRAIVLREVLGPCRAMDPGER